MYVHGIEEPRNVRIPTTILLTMVSVKSSFALFLLLLTWTRIRESRYGPSYGFDLATCDSP